MIKKHLRITGIVLAFVLVCMACPTENNSGNPDPVTSTVSVAITAQPTSRNYASGAAIVPLAVTATATDGATLSYQWYEASTFASTGGTAISGATVSSYQPVVADGAKFFYVAVTGTLGGAKNTQISSPARIQIGLDAAPTAEVTVTETQAQYVQGFGGMSNAFSIGGSTGAPARYMEMRDIDTMFNPDTGLGLTFLRIMIWPYPLSEVIRGEVEPQMNNAATYLNAVRRVNNYGGYVLASPWTAPARFKTNDALTAGGHLRTNMYGEYAQYLRNYASEMASYGAPIYAISIQNEPSLIVSYDGMEWTEEQHRNFLRDHGNFTRNPTAVRGFGSGKATDYVRVVSGEPHQVGTWWNTAMDLVIADPNANANLDVGAYHIYGGSGSQAAISRNGNFKKDTWMTEYNINSQNETGYWQDSTWDFAWVFAETIHQVIAVNESNAYIWWYLKRFYGIIGDGSYGTANGAVMPRGHVLSHYAKYATDTVMVKASTTHPAGTTNIRLSAYQRKSNKVTPVEQRVMANEDSISVVMYDRRTTTGDNTPLKINLPDGFTAASAFGIISSSDDNTRRAPLLVVLADDGRSAEVSMPINSIISIKFVK